MGADRLRLGVGTVLALVAATGCAGDGAAPDVETARVAFVVDGDTLRLRDGRRVRLVQIDSPEPADECFGRAATRILAALVPRGSRVELEVEPRAERRDRFGRLLRYVLADGRNLNVLLVDRGAAAPYFFRGTRGRHADELESAAADARNGRRGLWGACPRARLEPERALVSGQR